MDIGLGLPNTVPDAPGSVLLEWARRAEAVGFSTLSTIGRVAFPGYEELVALAAAGAVTERIGLLTNVLLAPTRDPVLLAKEAASVDQLSGGRLTLGLGVGARPDDYEATDRPFGTRGRRMEETLDLMHRAWRGEPVAGALKPVAPTPVRGPWIPILIGGMSDAALERTISWGQGWTAGGAPPEVVGPFVERVRRRWNDSGRDGEPRIVCLTYYTLGPRAEERAAAYLTEYYGPRGGEIARRIPKDPAAVRDSVRRYEDIGAHEVIFSPTVAELSQLEELAHAVF